MRKFELIKKYPGSPEIGCIATKDVECTYYKFNDSHFKPVPHYMVEGYSEYWKEIKEFPKIVAFRINGSENNIRYINKDGFFPHADSKKEAWNSCDNMFTLEHLLCNERYHIYQVQVESGEVFTIGDKVVSIINDVVVHRGLVLKFFSDLKVKTSYGNFDIMWLRKDNEPLFITEDGEKIYDENRLLWDTSTKNWSYLSKTKAKLFILWKKEDREQDRKAFSIKENALRYLEENKPQYSEKEMINFGNYSKSYVSRRKVKDAFKDWKMDRKK